MINPKRIIPAFLFLVLLFTGLALAQEESWLYSNAINEAKKGDYEFSFLNLHSLVIGFPQTKYLENSLFAIGEYHYKDNNHADATDAFIQLLEKFPDSKSTVFALAYLLNIAQKRQDQELSSKLEKAIATFHKLSLVFRNSKEFTYKSILFSKYKVIYYIDKVEFYKDGELFAQVSY
jgi:TolA-binding protein